MSISEQVRAAQRERDARLWATGVVLLPCLAATGGRPTVLVGALGLAACSWADALVGREAGAARPRESLALRASLGAHGRFAPAGGPGASRQSWGASPPNWGGVHSGFRNIPVV